MNNGLVVQENLYFPVQKFKIIIVNVFCKEIFVSKLKEWGLAIQEKPCFQLEIVNNHFLCIYINK